MQVIRECMCINDRHHAPTPRGCHLVAVEQPTGYTSLAEIVLCKYNKPCIPEIGILTSVSHTNAHSKAVIYSRPNSKGLWDLKRLFLSPTSSVEFHCCDCCIIQIVKIVLLLPMLTGQKRAFEYSLNNTHNFWIC